MSIFLTQPNPEAEEPTPEELAEIEKEQQKALARKATADLLGFFAKPVLIMLLWNWLMPGLFGLATIGYFKSLGLYALSSLLFKNSND